MSRKPRRRSATRHALRKHHLTVLVIVIPTLFFLFLIPLFLQLRTINALQSAYDELGVDYRALQQRETFYREAYEIALGDLRVLSTAYGGGDRYALLAQELRDQERALFGNATDERVYSVQNPALWAEYQEQGVVRTECIERLAVNTTTEEALFTVEILEGTAAFFIDGNYQRELEEGVHGLRVVVAPGEHELTLVSNGLRIGELRLEGRPVPRVARYDRGTTWQIFDCLDVSASTEGPGALRIPFVV